MISEQPFAGFIRAHILTFAENLHVKVFGYTMSGEMKAFLGNLSWSFGAGLLSALIMFGINIVAGRILGPLEFGKYNYILSLATTLVFFFLLGNNQSGLRYMADKAFEGRKKNIAGAVLFLTFVQTVILLLVVFVLRNVIASRLEIEVAVLHLVLLFGLALSFKELFDSFMRSFGFFKWQSLVKIGDALLVLISFFGFIVIMPQWQEGFFFYVFSMMIGAIFSVLVFLFLVRKMIGKFQKEDVSTVLHYNKFLIFGMLSGVIMSLEKVFIGKYIGIESLGIYSAYYASSQMIVSNLGLLFMNTFWPTVIRHKNNLRPVIDKLTLVFFRYFPVWAILNFCAISLFMSLYGEQYFEHISYNLLFSISSLLNIFFFVYISIMNIDKIPHSVIINTVIYGTLVFSIILSRSITAYLIVQIITYMIGIIYVRNVLIRDIDKKIL